MKSKDHIRPLVKKYLPKFQQYVEEYGPEVVKRVLQDGKYEKLTLTFALSMKDRIGLLKALGLI